MGLVRLGELRMRMDEWRAMVKIEKSRKKMKSLMNGDE